MTSTTTKLTDLGVSLWLDDLSRSRLNSENLKQLIEERSIKGVTTNPAIFQAAIAGASEYDEDLASLKTQGSDVDAALTKLTTDDVRRACDVFAPVYEASDGYDGRVSIEVDPRLAHDEDKTVEQAIALHKTVGRENVMIKIPATREGLAAITRVIAEGISVNVTLIFAPDRYAEVRDAYTDGLTKALEAGRDVSKIHSVASFFVSRVDSEVDSRLDDIGEQVQHLRGKAAIANAQVAYRDYLEWAQSDRVEKLRASGAHVQRPLWASTGVKNENYSDTMYVDQLIGRGVVNTVPEKTLEAVYDHADIGEPMDSRDFEQAERVLADLREVGIDLDDVYDVLEREGVQKFIDAWKELSDTVKEAL